jgi:hypothetical protein
MSVHAAEDCKALGSSGEKLGTNGGEIGTLRRSEAGGIGKVREIDFVQRKRGEFRREMVCLVNGLFGAGLCGKER